MDSAANYVFSAGDEFIRQGEVMTVRIDNPVSGIILDDEKNWAHGDDESPLLVKITSSLFDQIPKVPIVRAEAMPDVEDRWEKYGGSGHLGAIYFAIGLRSGLVKIGFTESRAQRESRYRTESAEPFDFLCMPGTRADETALHKFFRPVRVPERREWFYPHPAVMSYALWML